MGIIKLKKFLSELNKLSPINNEIFLKLKSEEILILKNVSNSKTTKTKDLFNLFKKNYSRAQFYRYLSNLRKNNLISVNNGEIKIN